MFCDLSLCIQWSEIWISILLICFLLVIISYCLVQHCKNSRLIIMWQRKEAFFHIRSFSGIRSVSFKEDVLTIGTGGGSVHFFDLRANKYLELNCGHTCALTVGEGWLVSIYRVPTFPGKPWKMKVYLENQEKLWNFAKNNKNPGKIAWNIGKIFIEGKK